MQCDAQLCPLFARHQSARGPQAAACPLHRNRFVHDEVGALTKNIANLFASIDQANNQSALVDGQLRTVAMSSMAADLIFAINHDGVKVLLCQPRSGCARVRTMFYADAQFLKNLTEHLHRISVRTNHQ